MNFKQHMTNHKRHQFCVSLALAALLLLLAGTANAYTVRCVPSPSLDPSCSPTSYATIQAAVLASAAGDIVLVGPGSYNEQVTINQNDLSVLGAQAGNDARKGRGAANKESIVNASNGAFVVNGSRVILDGFTVQGASSGQWAITVHGNGVKIFNNIVQKGALCPTSLSCGGGLTPSGTSNLVVRRNLFRNENDGIFATGATNAIVSDNVFTGHIPADPINGNAAAINFNSASSNITVSYNQADNNQTFIVVGPNTTNLEFSHNQGSHFSGTAVYVTGANDQLVISDNDLDQGAFRGIKFNQDFGVGTIQHATVSYNTITHMNTAGIFVQNPTATGSGVPTLTNSIIVGNELQDNGTDHTGVGIFIDAGNTGNFLTQNNAHGNKLYDCQDNSLGTGTLFTGNVWFDNSGHTSLPFGLCKDQKDKDKKDKDKDDKKDK